MIKKAVLIFFLIAELFFVFLSDVSVNLKRKAVRDKKYYVEFKMHKNISVKNVPGIRQSKKKEYFIYIVTNQIKILLQNSIY